MNTSRLPSGRCSRQTRLGTTVVMDCASISNPEMCHLSFWNEKENKVMQIVLFPFRFFYSLCVTSTGFYVHAGALWLATLSSDIFIEHYFVHSNLCTCLYTSSTVLLLRISEHRLCGRVPPAELCSCFVLSKRCVPNETSFTTKI